ncbi:Matrilin 2 [Balamuthia mandrillaris]
MERTTDLTTGRLSSTLFDLSEQGGALLLVFLADGSGSIDRKAFNKPLKKGLRFLAKNFKGCRLALLQFSDRVTIECSVTTNTSTFIDSVNRMKQMSQSTFTKEGMQSALSICENDTGATKKVIFLLTDGMPTPGHEPDRELNEAKAKGISVYALGVGRGVDENALRRLCTNGQYFHVSDYEGFVREVQLAQDAASAKAARFLSLDFTAASNEMRSNGELVLNVIVKNRSADTTIPAGQKIVFEKNNYFQPVEFILRSAVPPAGQATATITLCPKSSASEDDFPGQVEFIFQHGSVTHRGAVTLGTGFLRGDFKAPTPVNFLVFGSKGSGKSSLLNAIITCLSLNKVPSMVFNVMASDEHVTTFFGKAVLSKYLRDHDGLDDDELPQETIQLVAYDTWGTSADQEEYKLVGLSNFLEGRIYPGAHMDETQKYLRPPNKADEIHVVVFVVTLTSTMQEEVLEQTRKAMLEVSRLQYTPLLVVTRVDDVEEAEENQRLRKEILAKVPVNPSNVFFHKNYVGERERDVNIDLSTRRILRAICNRYNDRKKALGRNFWPKDVKPELSSVMQPLPPPKPGSQIFNSQSRKRQQKKDRKQKRVSRIVEPSSSSSEEEEEEEKSEEEEETESEEEEEIEEEEEEVEVNVIFEGERKRTFSVSSSQTYASFFKNKLLRCYRSKGVTDKTHCLLRENAKGQLDEVQPTFNVKGGLHHLQKRPSSNGGSSRKGRRVSSSSSSNNNGSNRDSDSEDEEMRVKVRYEGRFTRVFALVPGKTYEYLMKQVSRKYPALSISVDTHGFSEKRKNGDQVEIDLDKKVKPGEVILEKY